MICERSITIERAVHHRVGIASGEVAVQLARAAASLDPGGHESQIAMVILTLPLGLDPSVEGRPSRQLPPPTSSSSCHPQLPPPIAQTRLEPLTSHKARILDNLGVRAVLIFF